MSSDQQGVATLSERLMVPPADISTPSARLAQDYVRFSKSSLRNSGQTGARRMYICRIGTRERSPAVTRECFRLPQTGNPLLLTMFSSGGHNESDSHPPVW
jgi:hypothetical protein